jgi:hypothetical protein
VRKVFQILSVLALSVMVAIGIGVGVAFYRGHALDVESKAFVDRVVPAITAAWSKQQLLDLATPELRASATPNELTALFDRLSQLGALVKYEGATGESAMSYMAGFGSKGRSSATVSASYVVKAQFQNGSATFKIMLMKRGGRWLINGFHVDVAPGNRTLQHI